MKTQKGFSSIVLAILLLVLSLVVIFLFRPIPLIKTAINTKNTEFTPDVCEYGELPKEVYLDLYTVKPGDTLLSIANHQLGSTARINEIINLNKNNPNYNSLYTDNKIEVGWKLYISASYLPPNSGELVAGQGKLNIDNMSSFKGRTLVITHPDVFPTGTPTNFSENSVFFGTQKFNQGDCVIIIRDEGTDKDILMGLQGGVSSNKRPEITFRLEDTDFPLEQSTCTYHFYGIEDVMRKYTVAPGDSLSSVASEQLGDGSRTNEIVEANKDRYVSLKSESFVEVGWELLLPPRWAAKSTGNITAFAGTLLSEDSDGYWISKDLADPAHIRFSKESYIKAFGKDSFSRGDCVVVLNNRGTALGISSQDVDYVNLFMYGD